MRISRIVLVLPVLALALAAAAPAQSCAGATGTLTVTPDDCSGGTISVSSCGATNAIALLAVSQNAGTTTLGGFGPIPSVTLCVGQPFILFPLGFTGSDGCAELSVTIPPGVPLPGDLNLVLQGAFFSFTFTPPSMPTFSIVTTNTDTLCL